jgi:hypothetical protein
VRGAEPDRLREGAHRRRDLRHRRRDVVAVGTDDDSHLLAARRERRGHDVSGHGPVRDLVQHFRLGGLHPRAFAGGEDDGDESA